MTTPRWPVVLFDLDGTLVDTINLIVTSYQHAFRTVVGHEWPEAEIKSWIGTSLIDAFRAALGTEKGEEAFAVYTAFNQEHTEELIKGYAGVPELIDALREAGVRMGVVTSKRREPAEWALRLGHLDLPVVIAHEDVTAHKPDPAPLLAGLEKLGASVDEVVYVGDAVVDIKAARAAGLPCLSVSWGAGVRADLEEAHPEGIADTAAELGRLLLG